MTGHTMPPGWRQVGEELRPAPEPPRGIANPHLQPHPAPQYVYVERAKRTQQPSTFAFESLNVNVLTIASAFVFVVWATYFGTTQFQSLQVGQERAENKIAQTAAEIKTVVSNYAATTSERIQRLEDEAKVRALVSVSSTDLEIWCAKTERLNADIKWRCSPVGQRTGSLPPIWEGTGVATARPEHDGEVVR